MGTVLFYCFVGIDSRESRLSATSANCIAKRIAKFIWNAINFDIIQKIAQVLCLCMNLGDKTLSLFLFLFLFLSLFPPSLSVSRPLSAFISSVSFFSLSSLSLSPCIFLSHSFYLFKLPFSLSHTYLTLISRPFVYMRYNRLTILHIFCTFIFSFLFRGRIFYVVAVIFTFYHMCV